MKSTVAFLICWVTWIVSPAADAIRPATFCSIPLAGACVGADAALVGLADWAGVVLFEVPHAATENVAAPANAKIPYRISRGVHELTDINVSPIVVVACERVPTEATFPTVGVQITIGGCPLKFSDRRVPWE